MWAAILPFTMDSTLTLSVQFPYMAGGCQDSMLSWFLNKEPTSKYELANAMEVGARKKL